jgi:hypothetical protein
MGALHFSLVFTSIPLDLLFSSCLVDIGAMTSIGRVLLTSLSQAFCILQNALVQVLTL